ncbi:hypothetical protein CAL26_24225 [Bordetella genomosp. 9]|uniref:SiaC family regulatory phosphoprotein domain-containing protein n=1 Tax=Bordetella genomosp. 9 TaxID=1416803 RepID=A0A261R6F9_9BORD|nr:biofilm regulation phosphoprotein SiaC [Bordetella genomosp. 9]OZI20595.1 hypothetical protein CAL26_24225 [Bordetella genomosp. 9]
MKELNIPASQSTPSIVTDSENGSLHLSGDSYPENSFELFGPVIQWVDEYLASTQRGLAVTLELQYLNTSSVKAVMDIFDLLEAAHDGGHQVSVTWYYDSRNERVGELAEEFKEDCSFPFTVVGR